MIYPTQRLAALESSVLKRLLAINNQIRSTRKNKTSITDLVACRKQTDRLLSKVRHARKEHPEDWGTFDTLMTEYKSQVLP